MSKRRATRDETENCLRFLTSSNSTSQCIKLTLKSAPNSVIKAICNAVLNVRQGPIHLTPQQKALFQKHMRIFSQLLDRKLTIDRKRKLLCYGKIPAKLVPIILTLAFNSLGSSFISLQHRSE
jgi:hypothetical protein